MLAKAHGAQRTLDDLRGAHEQGDRLACITPRDGDRCQGLQAKGQQLMPGLEQP